MEALTEVPVSSASMNSMIRAFVFCIVMNARAGKALNRAIYESKGKNRLLL